MLFKKKDKAQSADSTVVGSEDVLQTDGANMATVPTQDVRAGEGLAPVTTTATEDIVYPGGVKLALLLGSTFISMFLVALDRLIIATAIPQITDDFHSVTDIGWYGSAYLLTTCAFQLLFGKLYTFYSVRGVFLTTVFLFEVGSAICGAAPNSVVFIVGRAIAGSGAAGIFSGVIVVIVYAIPLHKRPLYQGMFGAIFGLASVIGPLLGGALTSKVSWRWCFYINLPLGGAAMVFIALLLKVPDRDTAKLPAKEKAAQLDFFGTGFIIPGTVCLLLALQWGGSVYAWNEGRIIALLTLGVALLIGFCLVQAFLPKTATIPPRIIMQRSILAGFFATITIGAQMMIFIFFLPIWFQAIQGVSAVESGIRTLPMVLSMVVASMGSGILISRVGYYTPFMIAGVCIMSTGAGLLTTLELDTPQPKWIAYQFLWGLGMGLTFQAPNLAAQTVLPTRDVPVGTSLMFFSQLLGGAIFLSVAQNVLNSQLLRRLAGLPGFSPEFLQKAGATSLTNLPEGIKETVLTAYNESLREVFRVGLILCCLTLLGALALEWRSVKAKKPRKETRAEEGAAGLEAKAAPETDNEAEKTDRDGETETEKRQPAATPGAGAEKETKV